MNINGSEEVPVTSLLPYFFTTYSTVLFEKLSGSHLVKKFSAFYGTPEVHCRIHLLISLTAEFKILILALAWRN
jgi:hypothetical protein